MFGWYDNISVGFVVNIKYWLYIFKIVFDIVKGMYVNFVWCK